MSEQFWAVWFEELEFPGDVVRRDIVINCLIANDFTRVGHLKRAVDPKEWLGAEALRATEMKFLRSIRVFSDRSRSRDRCECNGIFFTQCVGNVLCTHVRLDACVKKGLPGLRYIIEPVQILLGVLCERLSLCFSFQDIEKDVAGAASSCVQNEARFNSHTVVPYITLCLWQGCAPQANIDVAPR